MLFVLIVSCASKDEKLQNYKDYIHKISNEIKFEDGFNIIKVLGERRSIFRSYFLNDELVFIIEDVSIGNRGSSANQYYFKDDKLINYTQKTILMKDDSLNISSKTMITFSLFLDGKSVLESDYWIGGVQTTVVESEVEKIVSHSVLLKELAEKNRPNEN
jgi:hypothetical protein